MKRLALVVGILLAFFCVSLTPSAFAWPWSKDKSSDNNYIKNDRAFDPKATDSKNQTNTDRMKKGLAPIGKDNKPVQIHHMDQKNDGKRIEMKASDHRKVDNKQKKSEIDRKSFNKERKQHWKDRAKDFK